MRFLWAFTLILDLAFSSKKHWEIQKVRELQANTTSLNVLHLSRHAGCMRDIESIFRDRFSLNLEQARFFGPIAVSVELAAEIWLSHSKYFNSFDVIITTDTVSLSRIFFSRLPSLRGRLITTICNRFDFGMLQADHREYVEEFRRAYASKNMTVVTYADYEKQYAKNKGVDLTATRTIYPLGDTPILPMETEWEANAYGPKGDPYAERQVMDRRANYSDVYYFQPYANEQDGALRRIAKEKKIKYFLGYAAAADKVFVAIMPSKRLIAHLKSKRDPNWPYLFHAPEATLLSEDPPYSCWHMYSECRIIFDSFDELFTLLSSLTHDSLREKKRQCARVADERRANIHRAWKEVLRL
jgi:hypothetical protein